MRRNYEGLHLIFFIVYLLFFSYDLAKKSQWVLDSSLSLFLFFIFVTLNRKVGLKAPSIILFNLALILHNLGTFGAYDLQLWVFGYDNLVHVFSSFAAGFIITKVVSRRLHYKGGLLKKTTVIDEHKVLTLLLVISLVVFFGTVVEIAEFIGYNYFGLGEGLFFYGSGDIQGAFCGDYFDVMTDLISNIVGALAGVLTYYLIRYKKLYTRAASRLIQR